MAYVNGTSEGRDLPTNHFEIAMTWLGLAQHGSFNFVPVTKESIADWFGTYRWRQRDLLVIDHGRPADDVASNVALVKAMIRALRDRDIQVGTWTTVVSVNDVDSNWGADAMYFGEAQFFSNRYQAALDGRDPGSFDEFAQINAGVRDDIAWIRAQPSTYLGTNARFAQNFGARAMYLAWKRGGVDAVNALYADKLITYQLMGTEERAAPRLKYHGRPRATDEWDQDPIVTALGAWGLYLSLARNLELDAAWSLALDWSGEQLFVYKGVEPNAGEDCARLATRVGRRSFGLDLAGSADGRHPKRPRSANSKLHYAGNRQQPRAARLGIRRRLSQSHPDWPLVLRRIRVHGVDLTTGYLDHVHVEVSGRLIIEDRETGGDCRVVHRRQSPAARIRPRWSVCLHCTRLRCHTRSCRRRFPDVGKPT
ncbi:MAG: hypothetical protein WDO74_27670 [Pseudomonadota bacterium]